MSRYNLFGQIHKALRAMLHDTALTLQQTNFSNKEEGEFALGKLQRILDVLDEHAENEDNFILPAVQQYEPSLTDAFVQQHVEGRRLAEELRKPIISYKKTTKEDERFNTGRTVNQMFSEFIGTTTRQMDREETVLNKILWRYYSDTEIMILNQRTTSALPQEQSSFRNWLVRGLTNAEIVGLMKAVGKNAPDFVFNSLLVIAEKELPGIRYSKVIEGLTQGALVA